MTDPIATYRLQLNKEFRFSDMKQIIPYLQQLGIGTVYTSPVMAATPGSMHGYDGVNPLAINSEIGTETELRLISNALKKNRIGWLLDIAPNHMAFNEHNAWLMNVLKQGPNSPYSQFFDILWSSPLHDGRLMVPFEGSPLEKTLKEQSIDEKYYRICNWKETDYRINYRRFFTINDLICLNMQDPEVFTAYHQYILQLLKDGIFQGLRIDHLDGLYHPTAYLDRIRAATGAECYIVVEKILQQNEEMPRYWPVQGSTGYDFLSIVNNVFTNPDGGEAITIFYEELTADETRPEELAAAKKAFILHQHMRGELDNLVQLYRSLGLAGPQDEQTRLEEDISTYLISCPVYRYYDQAIPVMERDKDKNSAALQQFYTRCMQFTGPLMAKGVEDTLMYTYNRFIGHNEVGDFPGSFGLSPQDFHQKMLTRKENLPLSLNATATHDTKRGEDARARLNALSDMYEEWLETVKLWLILNKDIREKEGPDPNDEYFIYQSLMGSYPMPGDDEADFKDRFTTYLTKALREAKHHSNWAQPNEAYENACVRFAGNLLNKQRPFWKSFAAFHEKASGFGIINSLAQLILKFTCSGIPDIYQGCELWDLSFVDPDNRQPVNYSERLDLLRHIIRRPYPIGVITEPGNNKFNAAVKLWLTYILLQERRMHADVFSRGDYIPLEVAGKYKTHLLAFVRHYRQRWYLVALPLHLATLCNRQNKDIAHIDWEDTRIILPANSPVVWDHVLTDKKIQALPELPLQTIQPLAVLSGVAGT